MNTQRTALITGAAGGIGKALVAAFVDRGYQVLAMDWFHGLLGWNVGSTCKSICSNWRCTHSMPLNVCRPFPSCWSLWALTY